MEHIMTAEFEPKRLTDDNAVRLYLRRLAGLYSSALASPATAMLWSVQTSNAWLSIGRASPIP